MMKRFLLAAAIMLLPFGLRAQNVITNDCSEDNYSNELGFFQKAYRDQSDPRFMFRDGDFAAYGIDTDYQSMPDITSRFKYRWDRGHIQFSTVLRNLAYWVYEIPKRTEVDGENRYTFAWGTALSGNWTPSPRIRFSAQVSVGSGISNYIRDFADDNLTLTKENADADGLPVLHSRLTAAGFDWVGSEEGTKDGSARKSSFYGSANLIFDLSHYCYLGAEYIHGRSDNYPLLGTRYSDITFGRANRLMLVFAYSF